MQAPQVIQPLQVGGDGPFVLHDPQFGWHFLAEGDSWFSIGGLPSSNLLLSLQLRQSAQVFNLAYPGDTIKHMSTLASNVDLVRYLAKPNFNYAWDAILLSGGGNDLVADFGTLVSAQPAAGADPALPQSYVDTAALAALLSSVQDDYARIVQLRDADGSLSKGAPILVHTYDRITPRNAPASFLFLPAAGPWAWPVLKALPDTVEQAVSDFVMDRLAEALLALDARSGSPRALPNVHVVDTRGTLVRAAAGTGGDSNDWLNEIHPDHEGYAKLAQRLSQPLNGFLLN